MMPSQSNIKHVAETLLTNKDLRFVSHRKLQSLWAGYGHICHIAAAPLRGIHSDGDAVTDRSSFILKYITPPPDTPGRESQPDEGHLRKLLSYQVELAFYTHLAPLLPPHIAVASCLASTNSHPGAASSADIEFKVAMLLTDLRPEFPIAGEKRSALTESQLYAALEWLAAFHGFWWGHVRDGMFDRAGLVRPPVVHVKKHGSTFVRSSDTAGKASGVWLNGGYTYLATRRGEYADLCRDEDSEWAEALCRPNTYTRVAGQKQPTAVAELVAQVLAPGAEGSVGPLAAYETLIHGDVKSENLFANEKGDKVAFYDFQYVGLGIGACDLAKLFTCSAPRSMLLGNTLDISRKRIAELKEGQQLLSIPMGESEEKLLRFYLERLRQASGRSYEWDVFVRHWEAALIDWLRFQASWGFWGNTEWLEGRARSILADKEWVQWLENTVGRKHSSI